jgi:hypothetical protein
MRSTVHRAAPYPGRSMVSRRIAVGRRPATGRRRGPLRDIAAERCHDLPRDAPGGERAGVGCDRTTPARRLN